MGPHGLVIGATGSGKSEFLRTLVLGLVDDALLRAAQPRARRLQGRRDLRRHGRHAARLGRDHQPRQRAHPRRPHAGRPVRRDDPAPGAAARRRQLRVGPRLREGSRQRRAARADAVAVHRRRRVLRDALGQAGVHRPLRRHRPPRPLARPAPAARLAAARGGPAARPGVPPVLPRRPAHLLGRRVAGRARRARRLRAARRPGPRLPQARPVHAAALQGGVRLGAPVEPHPRHPRRGRRRPRHPALHDLRGAGPRADSSRGRRRSRRRSRHQGEQPSLLDIAVTRMVGKGPAGPPGLAAAARRARHARRADARPRRGPRPRPGRRRSGATCRAWSSRSAPSTGRASSAATR